jgi:hypothetical protein
MEKTISIWFNQEAWLGRWMSRSFGQARCSRSTEAWPRWLLPLSTIQNTRRAEA